MTDEPTEEIDPGKVVIMSYYDTDTGACTSIDLTLHGEGWSPGDIASAVRALFRPAESLAPPHRPVMAVRSATLRHDPRNAETELLPVVSLRNATIDPGSTTTRLTFPTPIPAAE